MAVRVRLAMSNGSRPKSVVETMLGLTRIAVAFILAVTTTLPAGWCCVVVAPQSASVEKAQCPHCQDAPSQPSHSVPLPCGGSSGECCLGKAAVKADDNSQRVTDLAPAILLTIADVVPTVPSVDATVVGVGSPFESPPRHILQCVWRC